MEKNTLHKEISAMILQYLKGYAEDYLGEKSNQSSYYSFQLTLTMLNVKQQKTLVKSLVLK